MARPVSRWLWVTCYAVVLAACSGSPPRAPAAVAPTAAVATSTAVVLSVTATAEPAAPAGAPAPTSAPSAAPATGPTASARLIGSWEEAAALIDRRAPELMERLGVPGAALAIVSDGEVVWAQGYGLADRASGRPVGPETVFQAASISKSVTAWGVMRLVAEGRLDLDAPVGRYLTRWQLPPSRFDHAGVTIRRLLSHTAGLSLHGYPGIPPGQPLPTLEESLGGGHPGAGPVEVVSEPGTAWAYSGGGYTLLQLVVEEVTGEAFADYMRREVLEPLGMRRSSFVWDEALRADTAVGYGRDGQPQPNYLFIEQGPAGLYSTATDLARFAAAGLPGRDGEPAGRGVLPPELLALMYTPAEGSEEDSYGLGYQMNVFGPGLVGHAGANQGWKSFFGVIPAAGEGLVVLTNSHYGRDLRAALVDELFARARTEARATPGRRRPG